MDRTNLIYNGDFSLGLNGWRPTTATISNGVFTCTGDMYQYGTGLIPIVNGAKYRLSFDIKFDNIVSTSSTWLIALRTYDNTKNHIAIASTYKAISNCDTTLAAALNNGDTTVTLTNATNWPTSRTNQLVGIFNKLAWGYNRATCYQPYSSKSGNVITLKAAWSQGNFAAGTKVAECEYGSTYYYPVSIPVASMPTEWTTYTKEFIGGNSMRYSCQYFMFSTLGYAHTYSIRNLRIERIDDIQLNHFGNKDSDLTKNGLLKSSEFNDIGMPIRYIRDTINGSTANTANHWCEFEVYNYVGENIAWGRDVKLGTTTYSNSVATDGIINNSYIQGNPTLTFDIGYIENIHKIKIWHYYPDGRTYYNNVTEVSADGTNWFTVYQGQKPETAAGNEIILSAKEALIKKNGEIFANEIIEL